MQIIYLNNSDSLNTKFENPVVLALGFFECVHLGHKELIKKAIKLAQKLKATVAITTFTNSPKGDTALILTYNERLEKFKALGIELVVTAEFNASFKNLSGQEFLDMLTTKLNIKGLVCGHDYKFGKGASSTVDNLKAFSKKQGIKLEVVKPVIARGIRVSSTLISRCINATDENGDNDILADIYFADEFLGEGYAIAGIVIKGEGRGKQIGFATANIAPLKAKLIPKDGVYTTATTVDGKTYNSLTHIGTKPTFGNTALNIETHILEGFNSDIYGKQINILFLNYIRPIIKFDTKEDLIKQLKEDVKGFVL